MNVPPLPLSISQQMAVDCDGKRTLVQAGAGSGKTHVLVERTVRLIRDGYHPSEILLLTFTRKAAAEMRTRIEERMKAFKVPRGNRLTVRTFHSWAARLLREYADKVALPRNFVIRDEQDHDDLVLFAGRERGKCPAPGEKKRTGQWTSVSRLWQEDDVRGRYYTLMREAGALSYDDLESTLAKLFQQEDVAKELRGRWLHVLVDEYQDTNETQQYLLELLASTNLFVVGDHAQSIYRFRGAKVEGFVRLAEDPEWTVLTLPENYRSCGPIVEVANRLAAKMDVPGIRMVPIRDGSPFMVSVFPLGGHVSLQEWLARAERPWSEYAILAPTWKALESLVPILEGAGIPYHMAKRAGEVWESEDARWVVACLRCAINPNDHLSLWKALNTFAVRVSLGQWARLRRDALVGMEPILTTVINDQSEGTDTVIPITRAILAAKNLQGDGSLAMACLGVMRFLVEDLLALGLESRPEKLGEVMTAVRAWIADASPGTRTIQDFLDWYGCRNVDGDIAEPEEDGVTLTTIHGAKGLEWPVVLLAGWEEGQFPRVSAGESLEEARRLAYVAVTRASQQLMWLVNPEGVSSRFLAEAGMNIHENEDIAL